MVAANPHQGGATWAVLQYVLGLRRLGHDVSLVDPAGGAAACDYFSGLRLGRQAYLGSYPGPVPDLLLNVSGMLRDERVLEGTPIRVYLDLDPGFNQLWHEQGVDVGLEGHTHFVTVGRRIGRDGCAVPTCGVDWIATFPPVVLERWPQAEPGEGEGVTTVGNWRSYGTLEHDGVRYGQKVHSLRRFIELPRLCEERFKVAFAIHPEETGDLELLAANGWELLAPHVVAGTPAAYQAFLRGSKAELGVTKEGYVVSGCGWFSDRSACYLAAGRPVLAQDTGFGESLPTGAGLFNFATQDEALVAIAELNSDYGRHSRAARAIAEEFFDSDRVLGDLLDAVGAVPGRSRSRVHDVDEVALSRVLGRRVVHARRRPFVYRSTAPIVELEVEFDEGGALAMLFKDLSRSALGDRARAAKPEWLYDPVREIEVYRSVLASGSFGTPAFHGAVADAREDRYWLLIELVPGVALYQIGESGTWEAVMRWLARFHEQLAGGRAPDSLLRLDREHLLRWRDRARSISSLEIGGYDEAVERLARLPTTIVHGELYPSNVLLDGNRVCPVDWEMASVGPGVLDVAAITTGWDEEAQQGLADAYLRALASPPSAEEFERDLDCARLHLAVRWLGWADGWAPPPEHAHDWRDELARAEVRLGLREGRA
jgi:hypothetical protein